MTKKICLLLVLLFTLTLKISKAQDFSTSSKKWYFQKYPIPGIGIIKQGQNCLELRARVALTRKEITKRHHENYSLIGGAILFKDKATYFCPFLTLRYYRPLPLKNNKGQIGPFVSTSYWYTSINNSTTSIITPEIGFSIYFMTISYGLNYFLSDQPLILTRNRISIRLMTF